MDWRSAERVLAADNVALAMQHIARQKEIIALLREQGQPTALAEDLLKTFEATLREHIRNRALARALLETGGIRMEPDPRPSNLLPEPMPELR